MTSILEDPKYRETGISLYDGNPLIEVLPPILDMEDALSTLGHAIAIPESELALPVIRRRLAVAAMKFHVQATPFYFEFYCAFLELLHVGYVGRNPMAAGAVSRYYADDEADGINDAAENSTSRSNSGAEACPHELTTSSALGLIGTSGMGKTTLVKRVLSLIPQVVRHHTYKGRPFAAVQVVWLYLECPHDGSLKEFCSAFFEALDALLGTNYEEQTGRASIPVMMRKMRRLVRTYRIGALVIDEIQRISHAKAGGEKSMLDFFNRLINITGVPMVYVGTYAACALFAKAMSAARRAAGEGTYELRRALPDDPWWKLIVLSLWQLQWTEDQAPLTPEIEGVLYDLSQGITGVLMLILNLAQKKALSLNLKVVDEHVLRTVYDQYLSLLKPALAVLRMNVKNALQLFEDLAPRSDVLLRSIDDLDSQDATTRSSAMSWLNDQLKTSRRGAGEVSSSIPRQKAPPLPPFSRQEDIRAQSGAASVVQSLGKTEVAKDLRARGYLGDTSFEFGDLLGASAGT